MSYLMILSPAKSLRFGDAPLGSEDSLPWSSPFFSAQAQTLSQAMAKLGAEELMSLMQISRPLAELNHARFQRLASAARQEDRDFGARRAIFAFHGDAYEGLQPETLDPAALSRLNQRLRLLSGLYGVLRPSDAILPYRLEMGRRPPGIGASSLIGFWGDAIASRLALEARKENASFILNLASEEYAKAAIPGLTRLAPQTRVIATRFESEKASGWKVVSFEAKRARGLLARHLALSPASNPLEAASDFQAEGWALERQGGTALSKNEELLFRKRSSSSSSTR